MNCVLDHIGRDVPHDAEPEHTRFDGGHYWSTARYRLPCGCVVDVDKPWGITIAKIVTPA